MLNNGWDSICVESVVFDVCDSVIFARKHGDWNSCDIFNVDSWRTFLTVFGHVKSWVSVIEVLELLVLDHLTVMNNLSSTCTVWIMPQEHHGLASIVIFNGGKRP
jgi:hypothetical protein